MQVAFEPRCFWAEASVSDFHGASEPMSTEKPPKSVDERGDCVSEVVLISECEGSLKKEVLQKALLAELDAPLSSLPLSDMEAPGVGNNPETFRQRRLSTSVEALANAQIGESNATDITSADVQLGGDLQATKSTSIKKTPNPASVKKMSTPASVKNPSAPASLKKTSTPASVKKVPSCERAPEVEPSSVKEMSIPMPKEPASVKKNSIPAPEEPASVKKASSPAFIDQMSTPAPEEAASVKKALNPASIKKAPTPASAKKAPTPASSNKALTSAFISRVVTPSPEEPASVKKAPTPASIGRVSAPASDEPASVRKESTPAPEKIASVKKEPTPTSVKKAAATALEEVAPVKKAGTPASIKKAHAHEIAVPASTDKAPTPIHEVPRSVEKAPTPKLVKKAVTPASVKQAATPVPEESTSVRESSTPAPSGELMSQNGEITFRESEEADAHLETTLQTQIYASLSNMSDEDVRALKVTELRRLLTDLNLSSLGKKVELVQRLLEQRKEVNTEAQHLLDKSTEFEHVPRIRAMKRKAASADTLSVEDEVSSKGKARKVDSVRDSQEKELRPRGKKRLEAPMDEPQAPSRRRQTKS
ncbi:hypothetical protein AB1Y20_013178 [Prymnesium parvum]|uniref:SAP domain-containing protein n=1 Tax=Prymnesium parvum TaxID=97485 RepID=A0AB34IMU0_PRYPA